MSVLNHGDIKQDQKKNRQDGTQTSVKETDNLGEAAESEE